MKIQIHRRAGRLCFETGRARVCRSRPVSRKLVISEQTFYLWKRDMLIQVWLKAALFASSKMKIVS